MHRFLRWREQLQAASTESAVWRVLRDYVATLSPAAIDSLPLTCRHALVDPDVQGAAVVLLQAELVHRGDAETGQLLHEIAHTFAAASVRLSRFKMDPTVPAQ